MNMNSIDGSIISESADETRSAMKSKLNNVPNKNTDQD